MYWNYTNSKEWDKMLPVTRMKMKLTTATTQIPENKEKSLFTGTLDNEKNKQKVAANVLACCSSWPSFQKLPAVWGKESAVLTSDVVLTEIAPHV